MHTYIYVNPAGKGRGRLCYIYASCAERVNVGFKKQVFYTLQLVSGA